MSIVHAEVKVQRTTLQEDKAGLHWAARHANGEEPHMSNRSAILAAVLAGVFSIAGCALFCPEPSPFRETRLGQIRIRGFTARRRLRVVGHRVERNREGRLAVAVRWRNRAAKPFKCRIRVTFFDAQGRPEREAYTWDLHTFPPGLSESRWHSYTLDAERYRIEVRRAE